MRDAKGAVIEWFPSADAVTWLLWAAELDGDSKAVERIDEYGTTTIIHEDIPRLIQEAERAVGQLPHDTRKELVLGLIDFFRRAVGANAAIHFEGD